MPTIRSWYHAFGDSQSRKLINVAYPALRSKDGTPYADRYFHTDATWAITGLRDSIDVHPQHAALGKLPLERLRLVAAYDNSSCHARADLSAFGGTRHRNLERYGPVDACLNLWDSSGPAAAKTLPIGVHPCPYRADRDRSDHGTGSSRASRPIRLCDATASARRLVVPAAILLAARDCPFYIRVFGLRLLPCNNHQAYNVVPVEKPSGACPSSTPLSPWR